MLAIYLHVYACLHIAKFGMYIYKLNSLYQTFTVCHVSSSTHTEQLRVLSPTGGVGIPEGKLYKAEEKIKQLKEQIRDRQRRGLLCFFMFGWRYCWSGTITLGSVFLIAIFAIVYVGDDMGDYHGTFQTSLIEPRNGIYR